MGFQMTSVCQLAFIGKSEKLGWRSVLVGIDRALGSDKAGCGGYIEWGLSDSR